MKISVALAVLLIVGGNWTAATSHAEDRQRPNFLFILVDDQSPEDLKIYNPDSTLQTPVLERLAAEGMVFDAAHHMGSWTGAVCTASRTMIMSGRTVWHIPGADRALNGRQAARLIPDDLPNFTLPAVFNRAGYDTMRTCKMGNSYEPANKLFAVRRDATKRGGTAETGSAWHARQVLDYLHEREARRDEDPFLIYFGFSHPHDVRDGTPELLEKYGAVNHAERKTLPPASVKQPPLPVNYLLRHPFDNSELRVRDEINVSGVWDRRDERTIRNELGREFACSENIDIQIGRVLEKLQQMGELENTYIIYTADHGMAIGRHGLQGKQNLYEHTWRVPFIVKGPGIKAGSRVAGNIYLLDVFATLCDLAGVAPSETNEGLSFKPVLRGERETMRDVLYGVYCGGAKPGMRCVKQGDWKLIKYDVPQSDTQHTQLFNLAENPHELLIEHRAAEVVKLTNHKPTEATVNLADDARFADKRKELEALLLAEMKRLDDPYRLWDQPKQ